MTNRVFNDYTFYGLGKTSFICNGRYEVFYNDHTIVLTIKYN